jgi:ribosomal protein L7/L12
MLAGHHLSDQASVVELPTVDTRIFNDEPAVEDRLDRLKLAQALVATVQKCETPLVVGLHGTWGTGKTSLMRIMEKELENVGAVIPIWFDAWQHQFDENPVVALLHKMVDDLGLGEEGRRLLYVIAGAFSGLLLKATTNFSATELREVSDKYDEERFLIREKQIRLRTHFAELLQRATGKGEVRLVFFIDDLDRCVPEQVLRVLEALKLFLNMPGCVYVLGVDRVALENSIRQRYQGSEVSEAEYLDKIVQLPFSIPPIAVEAMSSFVLELLPLELQKVTRDLVECLDENPRQVKRFVNALLLNHELASKTLGEAYEPSHLAAILLLQYRKPDLFKRALGDPKIFGNLSEADGDAGPWLQRIGERLREVPQEQLASYIYLSEAASVRALHFDVVLTAMEGQKIPLIKVIRSYTGLGLKEAKELVDATPPTVIHSSGSREEAERMAADLIGAGGRAEVQ